MCSSLAFFGLFVAVSLQILPQLKNFFQKSKCVHYPHTRLHLCAKFDILRLSRFRDIIWRKVTHPDTQLISPSVIAVIFRVEFLAFAIFSLMTFRLDKKSHSRVTCLCRLVLTRLLRQLARTVLHASTGQTPGLLTDPAAVPLSSCKICLTRCTFLDVFTVTDHLFRKSANLNYWEGVPVGKESWEREESSVMSG